MNGCLIYQVDEDYEVTQQWYEALRQSYFKIDYFDLNETIILPHEVTSLSELQLNFTSYLLVGTLKCTSIIYQRSLTDSHYSYATTINGTGSVSKWLSLSQPGLIATLSTSTSYCNEIGARMWRLKPADGERAVAKLVLIENYGPDIIDITEEAMSKAYLLRSASNELRELRMNENESSSSITPRMREIPSNSMLSLNMKIHSFVLGSKVMIAQTLTSDSPDDVPKSGCPGVRIFSTHSGSMEMEYVIPACDVQHITTFTFGNLPDNYLVLAERGGVVVYHYEGTAHH